MRWRVATVLAATVIVGCGGGDEGVDIGQMEREIRADYQKQLGEQLRQADVSGTARVTSVECVEKKAGDEARCFANVTGAAQGRVGIDVTIGKNDEFLWEAPAPGAALQFTQGDTGGGDTTGGDTGGDESVTEVIADAIRTGIEADGYTVTDEEAQEPATAAFNVAAKTKGEITVYEYSDEITARAEREQFGPVEKSNPVQIEVRRVGRFLLIATAEEPSRAPESDLSHIAAIIRAGIGE
jgi:hypothetical protein